MIVYSPFGSAVESLLIEIARDANLKRLGLATMI
jgi:hypothetical protein